MAKKNTPALISGETGAVVPTSESTKAFVPKPEQLAQLAEIARVDLDQAPEALATLGADELNRAEFSVMRAGAYFLQLRQATAAQGARSDLATTSSGGSNPGFEAALKAVGVQPRQAQRAMQVAGYIAALPQDQARRMAALPKSRVLALVNADQEVVAELLQEGGLDGEQPLSVRELRKRIAALEADKAKLETQNALQRREAQRRYALRDESGLPPPVREARDETMVEAAALGLALDGLQRIADDFLLAKDVDAASLPLRPVLATTYVHALGAQLARASELFRRVRKAFGKQVGDTLLDDHLLDAESVARYRGAFEQILAGNQVAREGRDDNRANTQAGRKGRKRGS